MCPHASFPDPTNINAKYAIIGQYAESQFPNPI